MPNKCSEYGCDLSDNQPVVGICVDCLADMWGDIVEESPMVSLSERELAPDELIDTIRCLRDAMYDSVTKMHKFGKSNQTISDNLRIDIGLVSEIVNMYDDKRPSCIHDKLIAMRATTHNKDAFDQLLYEIENAVDVYGRVGSAGDV